MPCTSCSTHCSSGCCASVLYSAFAPPEPTSDEGFDLSGEVLAAGAVGGWLQQHAGGAGRTGVHAVGSWRSGTGDVHGLAFGASDGSAAFLDPGTLGPEDDAAVAAWLADAERPKALHDAKGPAHALRERGWSLAGLTSDTQLSAYLARPDTRTFDLSDLVLRYLKRELRAEGEDDGQLSFDGGDEHDRAQGGDAARPGGGRPRRRPRRPSWRRRDRSGC